MHARAFTSKRASGRLRKKKDLLTWLYTYQSLADDWKIDNGHKTFIENMIHEVEKSYHIEHKSSTEPGKGLTEKLFDGKPKSPAEPTKVTSDQFEAVFHGIEGVVRAKSQYSYFAMGFSVDVNELNYASAEKGVPKESRLANLKELKESLSDLRNFVPSDSAYSVVKNDIKKIERDVESDDAYKKDTQRTCDWSALILGTRSVNDILTDDGKAWLHFLFDLSGILFLLGVFVVVGSFLYGIFYVLTHAFNIDLSTLALSNGKDLGSTLSTVLSILAAVGLSVAGRTKGME